ncbi:unnamed protein product [Nezara viridula]|uniref:F-box domain-containing protein n=1 Tax=Nezara viridula TaxID=85310 RepID=A0A9P0GX92_NEZVI|nr:unnamed protein product [Nezara viridula]
MMPAYRTKMFSYYPPTRNMDIIGSLPPEIAIEILKYLNANDLASCCCVSKQWRSYANSDVLWKKMCKKHRLCVEEWVFCALDFDNPGESLEPRSYWATAFAQYAQRRLHNWRQDRKSVHVIATWNTTVVSVYDTLLAYTDELGVIFVYDLEEKNRFIQTIQLVSDEPVTALGLTKYHLIVRQGDVFTVFSRHQNYFLEGFLVCHEDSIVLTRYYYPSDSNGLRHAVIENGLCILYGCQLYIYSLLFSTMHTFKVERKSFLLHDHYRVYVATNKYTVTGFDANGYYVDFNIFPSSVISIKSNLDMTVALVSEEFHSGRYYVFKVWSRFSYFREFSTSRSFGYEVSYFEPKFASVANCKFGQRVLLTIYDLEYATEYSVDLQSVDPVAQAKLQFISKDLLYVITRADWGCYDTGYLIDLKTNHILYELDLDYASVVSIDSKLAVYLNSEAVEIHFYNRW